LNKEHQALSNANIEISIVNPSLSYGEFLQGVKTIRDFPESATVGM